MTTDLQTLNTLRKTNNPIAYNLNSRNIVDLIKLDGFAVNLSFQVALMVFSTVASVNSFDFRLRCLLKATISQNYDLQRVDNGLKSKGLNRKLTLETCENTVKSCYVHSLKRIT